jgi:hypothetical protein
MISDFITGIASSQTVIEFFNWFLLAILIASQVVRYEGPKRLLMIRYIGIFSIPLLVLFAINMFFRIAYIMTG